MLPPLPDNTILRKRYKLTNVVGQGGMGSIYRAEDLRLPGRLCAIKEVQPDRSAGAAAAAQMQNQFLQEASILAQLDHPNLPKVSDFFQENDRDYLVMDFVPGRDLKEMLEQSQQEGLHLEANVVIDWALQIIDALAYLHRQNPPVLHRDIKPANIKLTPDNRIKLVDFGLVKLMAGDESRTITVIQGRGTALYTPLEQYGGDSDHTDVRSDIYALGATLYHMLTGTPPPSAKERFLQAAALRPPRMLNPHIPSHVSEAVLWAMSMHPDDRPDNVMAFRQVLLGQARPPEQERLRPAPPLFVTALKENRAALLLAGGLFLLAVLLTLL
ncbi:MAG: hypothetical protein Fur0021_15250 [Candidatus Promineifilaceae bacterium]